MESFRVMHCAVDGELLESSSLHGDALSKKWLAYLRKPLVRRASRRHPLGRPLGFLAWSVQRGSATSALATMLSMLARFFAQAPSCRTSNSWIRLVRPCGRTS